MLDVNRQRIDTEVQRLRNREKRSLCGYRRIDGELMSDSHGRANLVTAAITRQLIVWTPVRTTTVAILPHIMLCGRDKYSAHVRDTIVGRTN